MTLAPASAVLWLALTIPAANDAPTCVVPARVAVTVADADAPTLAYAAQQLAFELQRVHGITCREVAAGDDPFTGLGNKDAAVTLVRVDASTPLAAWYREHYGSTGKQPHGEGWRIIAQDHPLRVVIAGETDVGVWYGLLLLA